MIPPSPRRVDWDRCAIVPVGAESDSGQPTAPPQPTASRDPGRDFPDNGWWHILPMLALLLGIALAIGAACVERMHR